MSAENPTIDPTKPATPIAAPAVQEAPADLIMPPAVSSSPTGEIPKNIYMCRIKRCTDGLSKSSNSRMLAFDCEIVAPDIVPTADGRQVKTAGKMFQMYATIDTGSKGFDSGLATLNKLQLLLESGGFSPSMIVNACNSGMLFFMAVLEAEAEYHRFAPVGGEKQGKVMTFPGTNQPLLRGYRISLPNAEDILARVPAPEGFVAPPY